jgi:ubiquinol-cytochrome c reductase cytochrome c1 subunit
LTGWNNVVFPNVAMPNPLWELQGEREVVYKTVESHGHEAQVFAGWKDAKVGTMDQREFNDNIGDLVAYLQWMGEPAQNTRVRIGVFVLFFLGIFTLIAWRLNAAFWKDIK